MKIALQIIKSLVLILISLFIICGIEYVLFLLSPGMSDQVEKLSQTQDISTYYFTWFKNILLYGDFGRKFTDGSLISETLKYSVKFTLKLTFGALLYSILLSFSAAILNVFYPKKWFTRIWAGLLNALSGFHVIILGVVIQKLIGLGKVNQVTIIPILILALGNGSVSDAIGYLTQAFKKLFGSDYIMASRARGGALLKNSFNEIAISLLSIVNSRFPYIVGGAFIVEIFFNINGLGKKIIDGIPEKEALFLMSVTLIVALTVLLLNRLVYLFHFLLDPRLRKEKLK